MHICMTRDNLRKNEISYTQELGNIYTPQTEILATPLTDTAIVTIDGE